jgi:tetratricopeptide (TPR) repeat protein
MFAARLWAQLWRGGRAWQRSRRWAYFLQGLPALLAGAGGCAVVLAVLLTPRPELEGRYLAHAQAAFKAGDYADAAACYDRLSYAGGNRPEVLFGLALTAESLGRHGRAAALMDALTPAGQGGYAPAHLAQARRLLGQPRPSESDRQEAEAHLFRALDGELDDPEAAHALLAELYLAEVPPRLDQAEPHLMKCLNTRPRLRLRLAQLYAVRGDKERARGEAQLALRYFRDRAKADLQNRQARLSWADAAAFLEDFPAAVEALREGLAVSDDPTYRQALVGVYVVWADALGRDPKAPPGTQIAAIQAGLRFDPANVPLLNRLLAAVKAGGPKEDEARAALQDLLASGQAPASAHFALGLDAWERGRADEARLHFERADALSPNTPTVVNNLAWVLANADPPDLTRALQLSNFAIERAPKEPSFRDTRGRVLARLGRWKEALPDLEAALSGHADNAELHAVLADAYERQDPPDPDMAAKHRQLAAKAAPGKKESP